jgi:cystathionine beta-lyase
MEEKITYDFDTIISRLGTQAEKYDAREQYYGTADVEPFWVADMDFPSPCFLVEALQARVAHGLFGYTEKDASLYDAISWWMNDQHGVEVSHEMVSLSPSVVSSISMAIEAYTLPKDCVVVLSPVYGPFFTTVKLHGREVADCPLRLVEGRYEMDWQVIEHALSDAKTKLLLLCNPQNPSGRVWEASELEKLGMLCKKYDVVLFSDEIHSDIVYAPAKHTSVLSIPELRDHVIMAHSIGKTFNTSGLKSSFSIVPNPVLRNALRRAHRRAHSDNINLLGKTAITHLFSPDGAEYKRQLNEYLSASTTEVVKKLATIEGLAPMQPQATFLVWCDFRAQGDWKTVSARLIKEAQVALSGGTFFGPAGEGWFRINCGHSRRQLFPAVDRICSLFS